METRTYFANNVPAALEVARKELGADALLLNSRPAPDEYRHFGRLEVTFAWDPAQIAPSGRAVAAEQLDEQPAAAPDELSEIRHQLMALRTALGNLPGNGAGNDDGKLAALTARLTGAGLSATLARELAQATANEPDERAALEAELVRRIPVAPHRSLRQGENRTLVFLGPPGRGKTTTLIKLAMMLGLAQRVPVRIYSAGVHAVGGREQMARYCAILGVPHLSFESLESLTLALNGEPWKGLVLIDTPGLSAVEQDETNALAAWLSTRGEWERHLVLRADASLGSLRLALRRFAPLAPSHLLFTGVDEMASAAPMAEALIGAGVPATFAATGPRIPEDIEEVSAQWLARQVLSRTEVPRYGAARAGAKAKAAQAA